MKLMKRTIMTLATASILAACSTDGTEVDICDKRGNAERVIVTGNVPYGHKIAVRDIAEGEHIIKYGFSIGAASRNIARGEYVHIHNMEALRGRGDLGGKS